MTQTKKREEERLIHHVWSTDIVIPLSVSRCDSCQSHTVLFLYQLFNLSGCRPRHSTCTTSYKMCATWHHISLRLCRMTFHRYRMSFRRHASCSFFLGFAEWRTYFFSISENNFSHLHFYQDSCVYPAVIIVLFLYTVVLSHNYTVCKVLVFK